MSATVEPEQDPSGVLPPATGITTDVPCMGELAGDGDPMQPPCTIEHRFAAPQARTQNRERRLSLSNLRSESTLEAAPAQMFVGSEEQHLHAAQTMVRDANSMKTTCYFAISRGAAEPVDESGEPNCASEELDYDSVWSVEYIEWNMWLHSPLVYNCLMITVYVLIANALLEEPYNNQISFWSFNLDQVPHWVGHTIFFVCHFILLALFVLVFTCMWPTRHNWLAKNLAKPTARSSAFWSNTRATEQWWTIVFGVLVISSIVIRIHFIAKGSGESYPWFYKRSTIFGQIESGLDVGWRAFRCYYLLYLSPRLRYGFVSALYVGTKLGSIMGLVIISFLFHYFLIVAFLPLKDTAAGIEYQEREMFFSSTSEGLYNLFVALTTANHPGILMPAYQREWYMMLFLFSFMSITNIFLLNVFLGVVNTQYSSMVQQFYVGKNDVCEGLLRSAYRRLQARNQLAEDRDQLGMRPAWTERPKEVDAGMSKQDFCKVIALAQSKIDTEKQELWFSIMDVNGDDNMGLEEFEKLAHIMGMPFVRTEEECDEDGPRFRSIQVLIEMDLVSYLFPNEEYVEELRQAELIGAETLQLVEQIESELQGYDEKDEVEGEISEKRRFREEINGRLSLAREDAEGAAELLASIKQPEGSSTYGVCVSTLILFSIFNSLFFHPAPDSQTSMQAASCSDSSTIVSLLLGIIFTIDVVVSFLAESTFRAPLHYFYGSSWFYNWTDIAVVLVTFVIVAQTCDGSISGTLYPVSGLLRVFRCIRMTQRIESFRRMYNAAKRVIPAITPQLLLFVTTYYSFAVFGMFLFAGCVTEVEEDGGPGNWSSPPWSETSFGTAGSYYQLNFDNIYSSFMTLFMLMIQNNWHVAVDGYVQCTGTKKVRLYFVLFNCINAMILVNIFIGVVLDMFNFFWRDEQFKMGEEHEDIFESFYEIITHRLDDKFDKDGNKLSKTWKVSSEIDSGLLYSGVTPSDAVMLVSEVAKHTQLSGLRAILNDLPMPIYVRTAGALDSVIDGLGYFHPFMP